MPGARHKSLFSGFFDLVGSDYLLSAARGICGRVDEYRVISSWENVCEEYEQLRNVYDCASRQCSQRIHNLVRTIDECFQSLTYLIGDDHGDGHRD